MVREKENIQFRLLYFFGILLIVAGHCDGGSISLFYEWFPAYSFHNALFVFCSGYFFLKNRNLVFKDFFKKMLLKFIVPLYAWNFVYGLIIMILHHFDFSFGEPLSLKSLFLLPIYDGHQFVFNIPTWFIPTLLILQIISYFLVKFIGHKNKLYILYFAISLFLGFVGVSLAMHGYQHGWLQLLCRIFYFIPFFSFGIVYRLFLEKYDKLSNVFYFTILFFISLIFIYTFGGTKGYHPSWCKDFDNIYRPFIVGFIGIFFWLRISKILVPSLKNSSVVNYISKNTYHIMIHHLFGFFILNSIWFVSSKILTFINGFNIEQYKSNIYYLYLPKDLIQFRLLYVVFGIGISLLINFIINKIKILINNKFKRAKN